MISTRSQSGTHHEPIDTSCPHAVRYHGLVSTARPVVMTAWAAGAGSDVMAAVVLVVRDARVAHGTGLACRIQQDLGHVS